MPRLKNPKAKGSRAERRSKLWLEQKGYLVSRAAGSLGLFDLVAVGPYDVLLVQVKAGSSRLSPKERAAIAALRTGPFVEKCWHLWPDRAKEPEVHYSNEHVEAELNGTRK